MIYDTIKEKPYILVTGSDSTPMAAKGIIHSLEENGIPFRSEKNAVGSSREDTIFECCEAPLGMVIVLNRNRIEIYYSRYDLEKPVLEYRLNEIPGERVYTLARRIGSNAANIIYGKEIKEI